MLAVMRDDHFAKLARALDLDHLADDPRCSTRQDRVANTALIKPAVQAVLLTASTAEWKRRLDEAGVPCSPVLELAAALSQPQIEHRGLVMKLQDAKTGRTMQSFNTAFQYAHDGPGPAFPPQRLGAQNEEVLTALGFSPDEIAELARREVI
jgi:formyl-CoA transferase/CoA:oxalate CoA-transferase